MKKTILLLPLAGLMAACQGNAPADDNTSLPDTPQATTIPAPASKQCYRRVTGQDTVLLELHISGDSASGHLAYRNFEKDGSEGTVRGMVHGKYIDLHYDFRSEGVQSTRRIVFRRDGEGLREGLAASFDKDGNPVYAADYDSIRLDDAAYTPVHCP